MAGAKRIVATVAVTAALLLPGLASATFVEIEATKCPKIGQKRVVKKTTYLCKKTSKGAFWFATSSASTTNIAKPTTTSVTRPTGSTVARTDATGLASQNEIPAVVQNFGFRLATYSSATGYAGDLKIRGVVPPTFGGENASRDNAQYRLLVDPIALQTVLGKPSPQMSIWLPLGTKVTSMVTGTVCKVEKLYSGDFTIMVAVPQFPCSNGQSAVSFEHEHVTDPAVVVGQKVTAGDVIATVSDYNPHWKSKGLGVVEIGILFGKTNSSSAWHACVAKFLDPVAKTALLQSLESVFAAWEAELADTDVFNERAMPVAGCYTVEEIPA